MIKHTILFALCVSLIACGHTNVSQVGLLSVGDLEGKSLPSVIDGPTVKGKDNMHLHHLSVAVRDALKGSEYDTIVDAKVTTTTGLFTWNNSVEVEGKAINSKKLPK